MSSPVIVYQRPDEATRTPDRSCNWIGEATVDGRTYTAISRMAPANDIARQLVAEGVSDRPLEIHTEGLRGALVWPSFHKVAERHLAENAGRPVHSISWSSVAARDAWRVAQRVSPKPHKQGVIAPGAITMPPVPKPGQISSWGNP
jgi:hypothetical protein